MGQINGVRGDWGYPEGGMGAVTKALASAATSYGAHIFTDMVSTSSSFTSYTALSIIIKILFYTSHFFFFPQSIRTI